MNKAQRIAGAKHKGSVDGIRAASRGELPMMAGVSMLPCMFKDDGAGDAELRAYDECFFDAWLDIKSGKTIQQIWREREKQ